MPRVGKSRYFGARGREIKGTARAREGERKREERARPVIISLVKASLLCEFLISVHLAVIPPQRECTTSGTTCGPPVRMRTHTHLNLWGEAGQGREKKGKIGKKTYFPPGPGAPEDQYKKEMYDGKWGSAAIVN